MYDRMEGKFFWMNNASLCAFVLGVDWIIFQVPIGIMGDSDNWTWKLYAKFLGILKDLFLFGIKGFLHKSVM